MRTDPGSRLIAALLLAWATAPAVADQVAILDTALDALEARIHILESADRTIDVMYFAIYDDEVTRLALGLLREKALAGVRVRLITNPRGFKVKPGLLHYLQALDTFEIRVFDNPTIGRFKFLRRLHDNLLLADSDHYITGGRNVGAAYFDMSKKENKKDRDIYVIGASATAAQDYFDDLWSSSEVSVAKYKPYPRKRLHELDEDIAEMEALVNEARQSDEYTAAIREMSVDLRTVEDRYVQFVHDEVEAAKVQTAEVLTRLTLDADASVLVQSPYIVPDKGLFRLMEVKRQQSVPVTFVTNSVKSTVNVIATAATERYKKRMLDLGAVFYESTGTEMLHAKSMVYRARTPTDGGPPCWGSVGSYNVDPRSARLNTETFVGYCQVDRNPIGRLPTGWGRGLS